MRCYDVKLSGNFKCGRCGCTFKTKPVNDTTASLPIESSSSSQLDCKYINVTTMDTYICNCNEDAFVLVALEGVFLVDFSATNLNLSPTELTTRLNETLAKCEEELHKVEEISKG